MAKGNAAKSNGKKTRLDEKTLREIIEKKAYEMYEKRGAEHGRDVDDWLEAERIVMEMRKERRSKEAGPSWK